MQAQIVLHKLLEKACGQMHQMRQACLEAVVMGALIGQRLTVTDLGRSLPSQTSHKHNIKRADRLLSNTHLHGEWPEIYRQLARVWIAPKSRPVVVIDWSDMDEYKHHFVLRASVALQGRSVTVYEEVHTVATKEKLATHRWFLHQLKAILPPQCRPILVTDAGFRTTWFKLVLSMGWDYVGRVRNRHYMRWEHGGRWFDAKRCYQEASSRPRYLGAGVLTQRNEVHCQFVIYQGKPQGRKHLNRLGEVAENSDSRKKAAAQREPWLLATSLPVTTKLAKNVVAIYRMRMSIEEGFRDLKSHRHGLGLAYHRTHSAERLQMLLLVATLAMMVIWLLGMAAVLKDIHYQYQANSVRYKRVLSVVFIGLKMIREQRIQLTQQDMHKAWITLRQCLREPLWQ
jgi:hypothetical protein